MIAETIATLKLLIDGTNGIVAIWKNVSGKPRRREVGAWLNDLGNLVDEVSTEISAGRFPHAACAKMGYIVDSFDDVVGSAIEEGRRIELREKLEAARNLEMLFGEARGLDQEELNEYISQMQVCAGVLRGAGSVIMNS